MPKLSVFICVFFCVTASCLAQIGKHSFSIAPIGLISPSEQTIRESESIYVRRHIHWDYAYRINQEVSFRLGLDDSEETEKESWHQGRTMINQRTRGLYLGTIYHFKGQYGEPFTLSVSGQLGLFRTNYASEVYTYTNFNGGKPVVVGVKPTITNRRFIQTSTRLSAYLAFRMGKSLFAFMDPCILLTQYHEDGKVSILDAHFGADRILGIGFRI